VGRVAIIGGVVVVLALIGTAWGIYRSRHTARREDVRAGRATRGDLNRTQELALINTLDEAAHIMRGIGTGDPLVESVDYLSEKTRRAVTAWLRDYDDKKWGTGA